jgi:hypothetical protein
MKATFQVDDAEFQAALKAFFATSRKSVATNLKDEGKRLVKAIIQLTPPNKEKENKKGDINPSYNLSGGKKTIANDLAKIFRQSKRGTASPESFHKRFRDKRGRVRLNLNKGNKDRRIRIADLAEYKKKVQARVGYMAAGWKAAAASMGINLPAWISRHSAAGKGRVSLNGERLTIELSNNVVYPGARFLVERRVDDALRYRARTMMSRVNHFVYKAAKGAGFEVV